jgi:hypothetical protein
MYLLRQLVHLQTTADPLRVVLSAWGAVVTGCCLVSLGLWQLRITKGVRKTGSGWRHYGKPSSARKLYGGRAEVRLSRAVRRFWIDFLRFRFWPDGLSVYGTIWMAMVYIAVMLLIVIERKAEALPFYRR